MSSRATIPPGTVRKREDNRLGPGIADLSNLTKDGKIISAEDRVWFFKLGDRLWHSDSSFPAGPGQVLAAVRAHRAQLGRQYRVRRHARGL